MSKEFLISDITLEYLELKEINVNIEFIYHGLHEGFLSKKAFSDFFNIIIKENPKLIDDQNVVDLLIELPDCDNDLIFKNLGHLVKELETADIKWRYLFLDKIVNHSNLNFDQVLELIANKWADWDYPEDMKGIINYMPNDNGEAHHSLVNVQKAFETKISNYLLHLKKQILLL